MAYFQNNRTNVLKFIYSSIICLISVIAYSQDNLPTDSLISEYPHIFIENGDFKLIWVENGVKCEAIDKPGSDSAAARLLGFSPYSHYRYTQKQ